MVVFENGSRLGVRLWNLVVRNLPDAPFIADSPVQSRGGVTFFLVVVVLWLYHNFYRRSKDGHAVTRSSDQIILSPLNLLLITIFSFSILVGFGLQIIQSLNNLHGNWDAWSFWNLRASFFFKNYPDWMIAFDTNASNSNLDYPLLIPCLIFRMWSLLGTDSPIVPIGIGIGFTVATLMVLVGSVWLMRGMEQALVAGVCLISAKMFMVCGADQYSDIPIGFYFLGAIAGLFLGAVQVRNQLALLFLAGIFLGFATWTKNEGLLVALSLIAAGFLSLVIAYRALSFFKASIVLLGLSPILCVLLDFKINVAPVANAYVSVNYWDRIFCQLRQSERYIAIAKRFFLEFFTFHRWGYVAPFMILYGALRGFSNNSVTKPYTTMTITSITLILLGYFFIYVITPQELIVHLDTSLNRLVLHVFPVIIFVFFVNVRSLNAS